MVAGIKYGLWLSCHNLIYKKALTPLIGKDLPLLKQAKDATLFNYNYVAELLSAHQQGQANNTREIMA